MESKALLLVFITISSVFIICNAGGFKQKTTIKQRQDEVKKGRLQLNFYKKTCPRAEEIVKAITERRTSRNLNLGAKLLRLQYHDCFVRGCDGSILLDTIPGSKSERDARPNLTLEGFEIIKEIKTAVEKECKQTVSCADILALSARDAVSFPFGRPMWKVLTGRRDGRITNVSEAVLSLPSPFSNFTTLKTVFSRQGLSVHDLVTLSGAHTIGRAHCSAFRKRLFNFTGIGDQDPTIDPKYANNLKAKCRNPTDTKTTVEMDPDGSLSLDNHYHTNVEQHKGLFQSDAALLTDKKASQFVKQLAKPGSFFVQFAVAVQKMGAIQVLTGSQGEIRKVCNVVNK